MAVLKLIVSGLLLLTSSAHATRSCGDWIVSEWGPSDEQRALTLSTRIAGAWERIGGAGGPSVAERVLDLYRAKDRAYHDVRHLEECLEHLDLYLAQDPESTIDRDVMTVAFAFHDAIYDTRPEFAPRNEAASVQLFLDHAHGVGAEHKRVVENLIMATKTHDGATEAERVFVDIDLAILGSDVVRFAEYEMGVRAEFAWVPADVYRVKRAEVLAGFAARSPLYRIPYFRYRFERRAQANLRPTATSARSRR